VEEEQVPGRGTTYRKEKEKQEVAGEIKFQKISLTLKVWFHSTPFLQFHQNIRKSLLLKHQIMIWPKNS
jgi:hypothetical protein